jgi:hypothetical protein
MTRSLSVEMMADINGGSSGDPIVALLELDDESFASPIRLTNYSSELVHNGRIYEAAAFDIVPPEEGDDVGVPVMTLTVEAVSRQYVTALRGVTGEHIDVRVTWVLASAPEIAQTGWLEGRIFNAELTFPISATITVEPILDRAVSVKSMDQSNAPGLF